MIAIGDDRGIQNWFPPGDEAMTIYRVQSRTIPIAVSVIIGAISLGLFVLGAASRATAAQAHNSSSILPEEGRWLDRRTIGASEIEIDAHALRHDTGHGRTRRSEVGGLEKTGPACPYPLPLRFGLMLGLTSAGLGVIGDPTQNAASPTFASGTMAARAQSAHMHAEVFGSSRPLQAVLQGVDPTYQRVFKAGWAGTIRTIADLAGTWAADSDYDTKLMRKANEIY